MMLLLADTFSVFDSKAALQMLLTKTDPGFMSPCTWHRIRSILPLLEMAVVHKKCLYHARYDDVDVDMAAVCYQTD